jgi:hypothetical protein
VGVEAGFAMTSGSHVHEDQGSIALEAEAIWEALSFDFHATQHIDGLTHDGHALRAIHVEDVDSIIVAFNAARPALDSLLAYIKQLEEALQDELDNWNPEARPTISAELRASEARIKQLELEQRLDMTEIRDGLVAQCNREHGRADAAEARVKELEEPDVSR